MAFWSSWKRNNKPKEKFYGGSKEQLDQYRNQYQQGIQQGRETANAGVAGAQNAANVAREQLNTMNIEQQRLADDSNAGFRQSAGDYQEGRDATLANAGALEADAATMEQKYQNTADSQFRANQSRNMRMALALGNRGGAAGVRAALDAQGAANAQAAVDAENVRAQQMNQMIGMRQNALQSAANIRGNVGAQDQSAAGLYSNRQQQADANRMSNVNQAAQLQQSAGQLAAQTGMAQQGQYLDAQGNMENAQLNSQREHEQLRIEGRRTRFNRIADPLGLHGGK